MCLRGGYFCLERWHTSRLKGSQKKMSCGTSQHASISCRLRGVVKPILCSTCAQREAAGLATLAYKLLQVNLKHPFCWLRVVYYFQSAHLRLRYVHEYFLGDVSIYTRIYTVDNGSVIYWQGCTCSVAILLWKSIGN